MDIATRKIAVARGMSFTGVKLRDTNFVPTAFHTGGDFLLYIHALAMLPPYLQLARELAMLCVSDDVAEARLKKSSLVGKFSLAQLTSGRQIAMLMVAAQDKASFQVLTNFVVDARVQFDVIGNVQFAVTGHPVAMARQYLLGACAVLDPTSSLLLELTHPNAHSSVRMNIADVQLDVQLSKETRVIEVDAVAGATFRPNDIRVGDSVYKVASCIVGGDLGHFEGGGGPQRVSTHPVTGGALQVTQFGTTSFVRVGTACRLFLVRA